jgi:carbon storage regulator
MLVLTRKKNESIVINNEYTVTVIEIKGDKIKLGIDAPIDVPVHRKEIQNLINEKVKKH